MAETAPLNSDPQGLLKNKKIFAMDLDGTVYLGSEWIDGAQQFLSIVRELGRSYKFLTNNSSRGVDTYCTKLTSMGLETGPDSIISSGNAAVWYLKKNYPGKKVFLMGNDSLKSEFSASGIQLSCDSPDVLVAAFDTSLTYEKLRKVCDLVRGGIPYIATHADINCPTETGFMPDLGAMMELIKASAGRYADVVIGKPNRPILDYMLERLGASKDEICVVGDRLYTDIAFGINNGITSVLVLSGETSYEDMLASKYTPDLVFSSVKEMIPCLA